jgi:crossover junction endodeoxyribonuclease RusA
MNGVDIDRIHGRLTLALPYPPSNNRYYRHGQGRTYLSAEGRAYRMEVLASRPRFGWPVKGSVSVVIEVTPSKGKGQDLDNVCKAILDGLQFANIIENDRDIDDLRIVRRQKQKRAGVMVTVETC